MHYQYLILSPYIGLETDNLQNFKANQVLQIWTKRCYLIETQVPENFNYLIIFIFLNKAKMY